VQVLYVASNPIDRSDLELDREITELQRRFAMPGAEAVKFAFLPNIRVEDLPGELSRYKPDVLHIAAHGETQSLALSDEAGTSVPLTAEMLRAFLPPEHIPRLIYLNACDSETIAQTIVDAAQVPMAIGTTAPITNRAARAAAVAFYERVLAGTTVASAFEACEQMLRAMSGSGASATFHRSDAGVDAAREVLHAVPIIIADFETSPPRQDRGHYLFRLGISGCPTSTTQVIFFTDDESFVNDIDTLEDDLSLIVRSTPVVGVLWSPKGAPWRAEGDHRLAAVGLKAGEGYFALESTLCKALEKRYASFPEDAAVQKIIAELRRNNGAELDPTVWDKKGTRAHRKP
jgi:hypothetical protein